MKTIIEAGHFYSQEGVSKTSKQGWELGKDFQGLSMLFIDDVHSESQKLYESDSKIIPVYIDTSKIIGGVSEEVLSVVEETNKNNFVNTDSEIYTMSPEIIVLEGEMKVYTEAVIEILQNLPRKRRAKLRNSGTFCSNIKIANADGKPTCVGYDLGLTYFKEQSLKAHEAINILPLNYEEQQEDVHRIYKKVNPDFDFHTLFFNPKD